MARGTRRRSWRRVAASESRLSESALGACRRSPRRCSAHKQRDGRAPARRRGPHRRHPPSQARLAFARARWHTRTQVNPTFRGHARMTQARDELRLFREFLTASQLPALPDTVESRLPPEPDVACRCADGSELRFELVEIVDEHFARMVSDQIRLQTHLEEVSLTRPALQARLGSALVFIGYRAEVPLRERERHARSLMELLEALPDGFVGAVDLPASLDWTGSVRFVRISRGTFAGPTFQVEAATFLGNPIVDRLDRKCQKTCSGSAPIELLAFFELQPTAVALWHDQVARSSQRTSPTLPFAASGSTMRTRSLCFSSQLFVRLRPGGHSAPASDRVALSDTGVASVALDGAKALPSCAVVRRASTA